MTEWKLLLTPNNLLHIRTFLRFVSEAENLSPSDMLIIV